MTFVESPSLHRVKPSAAMLAAARVRNQVGQRQELISLGVGEPDFETPQAVQEAAIRAILEGRTRYTDIDGIPQLKAAVCAKLKRDNELHYDADQITIAPGGKAVIYNALVATLASGDEVIIPSPYWVSYPNMVLLAGGAPVIVPTDENNGFKLIPEILARAIGPRTKWVILNSPCNPTGAVYSRDELAALADVLTAHPDVWVMSDDIYEHILFDGAEFSTIAQVAPALRDRILTVNGVSKAYAMTGWRIGYAAGPTPIIRSMRKVMSQSTSNASSISQWASVEALLGDQHHIAVNATSLQQRRDRIVASLNAIPGISCMSPQGTFYVYPTIRDLIGKKTSSGVELRSDLDFVIELTKEQGCVTLPGDAFGASPFFRASFAVSDDILIEACSRIEKFCASLI